MASTTRGALASRLARHFAGAAVLATAASASADIQVRVYNQVIPATIDGLYINVETGATGSSGGSTAGWDINPYSSTALTFFNATGTGMMRYPGVTTGSAGNLAPETPINAAGSFGSGTVAFGANPGNWQLNSTNLFGFRFVASDGLTHYAWGRIAVGATVQDRTLLDIAWETIPATQILAGSEGGPPPDYDPCAPFNPSIGVGANNPGLNLSTSTTLDLSASCGLMIYKANFFKFTAPVSGEFTFSTCGAGVDTRMAVLSDCDATIATTLGCDDDSCEFSAGSEITLSATEGTAYYIVVGGTSPKAKLPSSIAIEVVAPANPACVNATALAFGENFFDNTAATTSQTVASTADGTGTATVQKAQWFSFTAGATGAYSISLCGASGDTMLGIGTACPGFGQKFATIAYNDDACQTSTGSNLASFIDATNGGATGTYAGFPLTQDLVAGETYYILAGSFSATVNVTATLVIDGPPQGGVTGDLDGDGFVNASDLAILLSGWGLPGATDLDGDGSTGAADLAILLGNWSNG